MKCFAYSWGCYGHCHSDYGGSAVVKRSGNGIANVMVLSVMVGVVDGGWEVMEQWVMG